MTRREAPGEDELRKKVFRRWEGVEERRVREKRGGGRGGMAMGIAGGNGGFTAALKGALGALLGEGTNGASGGGKHRGGGGGSSSSASNGVAAGASSSAASGNSSTASTSPGSGAGFSQVDLNAATDNTVSTASTPTAADSLGLDIESNDVGYFSTLQLGTPSADFKILMDSGSADFWVPSAACGTACGDHAVLSASSSSTLVTSQTSFQVTYGTGSVSGNIIQDTVNIAGLVINNHTFGGTTTESTDFSANTVPFDGLMGLAQSTLSNQGVPTPIESLASAGTVSAAQMGFHLARLSDGNNDGQVTFGGVDSTKFTGSLTEFANVNTQGFWEGAMDDVSVNGASLNLAGRTAILDTGTTLIVAPAADAAAVHAAIAGSASDGQGGFTIPCTTTASVALSFGGQSFTINPSDLTFLPVTNDLTGQCVSGISSGTIGGANEWLVGDVFLKNVYFATDVGSNTIGLAPAMKA